MTQTPVLGVSITIGLTLPLIVYWAYRSRYLTGVQTLLFVLGSVLGSIWETALLLVVPRLTEEQLYTVYADVSVQPVVHAVSHSFWDGGLFLVGVFSVERFTEGPHFRTFRWRELGVIVVWGQVQSLAVEITAIGTGMWTYHPTALNPSLFRFGDDTVTVAPQFIWLVATIVFYGCCLLVYRRWDGPGKIS